MCNKVIATCQCWIDSRICDKVAQILGTMPYCLFGRNKWSILLSKVTLLFPSDPLSPNTCSQTTHMFLPIEWQINQLFAVYIVLCIFLMYKKRLLVHIRSFICLVYQMRLVYACVDTCCSHFLTIIAGVDLHFRHESELPVCQTWGLNPGHCGARWGW